MIKIMSIFGTRPEAIKMLPIIKEIQKYPNKFKNITVVTGPHREMLDQVLTLFRVVPDYDLQIMHPNQTLTDITLEVLSGLSNILALENPDIVLVHGDTTTTFAASLSAFYHKIPVGHVEAGLRTWDRNNPFPEELNRQLTDSLSELYFAPTEQSKQNLLKENHPENNIFVTGNTAIDAIKYSVTDDFNHPVLEKICIQNKIILLTMHRRENQGQPMIDVFKAIIEVVERYQGVEVIFPVHLSPKVQKLANSYLKGIDRIHMIEPLNMFDFHNIISRSSFILTDSGGIQEEAPALNKPVLVLRSETERPEGVLAGASKLIGTDTESVLREVENLLLDDTSYSKMANAKNPYGDGMSAMKIVNIIENAFKKN